MSRSSEVAAWLQHLVKMLVGVYNDIAVIAPNTIERTLAGKVRQVVDLWPCQQIHLEPNKYSF